MTKEEVKRKQTGFEIAVIGMSGRFPQSDNIDKFWKNLKNGVETVAFLSEKELEEAGVKQVLLNNTNFIKVRGSVLEDKEFFDASFFNYTPSEAEVMDPQIRIFHECAWEALEDAAYDPYSCDGLVGLFAGASCGLNWHAFTIFSENVKRIGELASMLLREKDFLSTRIAYKFNLKGPAVLVQSACSTSLVAIHMACRALLTGECHIALAGGVSISPLERNGYLYQEDLIASADGHCKAFDADAAGTIGGDGVGVVVLKRLKKAVADRDNIYAVILGSAVNNDGMRKVGYTAPSIDGQEWVIRAALQLTGVEPESISYIETHGTGTVLGDPIELKALKQAFNTKKQGYCKIGSLKTNIGHTGEAAGVAGFIKTVLCIKNRQIPPSLNFRKPNPKCGFEESPFEVNTELIDWENEKYPLRAGVSSFGIGGTNAHVILEEAPEITADDTSTTSREFQLILLSAKTEAALNRITENLIEYLKKNKHVNLADVAYTLQVGRKHFMHRRNLVCSNNTELIDILDSLHPESEGKSPFSRKVRSFSLTGERKLVVFMFPGLGTQYVNMGLELYQKEVIFREEMERCFEIVDSLIEFSIKDIIFPGEGDSRNTELINQVEISSLVVFIFEYALARLLIRWGIKPDAMIGYSFGEYVSACLSGVFTLNDALELIVFRGGLLKKIPAGAMLSVPLSLKELYPLVDDFNRNISNSNVDSHKSSDISIAIDNGPSCVLGGPTVLIDEFEQHMKAKRYLCVRLKTSKAIHSRMMEPILKEFEGNVSQLTLNKPRIPYISNVTGHWITEKDATDPVYWSNHLKETVRFSDGVQELLQENNAVFVEVGPGLDLTVLLRRYIENKTGYQVVNLVRPQEKDISDVYYLLNKIARLWIFGINIDWSAFYYNKKRQRLSLPTYSFDRQYFWPDGGFLNAGKAVVPTQTISNLPGKHDVAEWFYVPSWQRQNIMGHISGNRQSDQTWMIFSDSCGLGAGLIELLKGERVITIKEGTGYANQNNFEYTINPGDYNDYEILFRDLISKGLFPHRIIHSWGVTNESAQKTDLHRVEKQQFFGFYSLLYLAKAISENSDSSGEIEINVITNNMQDVTGDELIQPGKAAVLGPCKVIPQEYPGIVCRSIDIPLTEVEAPAHREILSQLMKEFSIQPEEKVIAYRGNTRWVQIFNQVSLSVDGSFSYLRDEGVYLIIGGLGGIGLILAEYLIKNYRAKVILTGRSKVPGAETWPQLLQDGDNESKEYRDIQNLHNLRNAGGDVIYFTADISDKKRMEEVIMQSEDYFGKIDGVIHSAGIISGRSFRSIDDLTPADCHRQFQAKVYGLLVLEELLQDRELDFCLMISSISSILGGLGFAVYSAVNNFMDAFFLKYKKSKREPWIVVNWDGTSREDTEKAFHLIFSSGLSEQVIFSKGGNLEQRILRWVRLAGLHDENKTEDKGRVLLYSRPDLSNPYAAPRDEIEKKLTDMWQKFFGIEKVGIYDDFLELGGDSLKAIALISRIHKEFNVRIKVVQLVRSINISQLAELIKNESKDNFVSINPTEKKEYYRVSYAQKGIYLVQQADLHSTAYNETHMLPIDYEIEKERLENAFKNLIQKHESLRTSIKIINEEPVQVIHRDVEFHLIYFEAKEDEVKEIVHDFVKPFDLNRPPFLKIGLINLEKKKNLLILDIHHIIFDGISVSLITADLMYFYYDKKNPELRLQYKDYSEWQKSNAYTELIRQQDNYWLEKFKGDLPVLKLPIDYERPAIRNFEGDIEYWEIGKIATKALKKIMESQGTTMFVILFALFYISLSKISDQEDIIVGTPTIGRRHIDLFSIIGLFVNTLAIRNRPSGEKTFIEFLNEIKVSSMEAFENQEYPFEYLVEKIVIKKDLSRTPVFDALFSIENVLEQPKSTAESEDQGQLGSKNFLNPITKFDFILVGKEANEKVYFALHYSTKLFKKETIKKFVGYFKEIISIITKSVDIKENKDIKLKEIEISHGLIDSEIETTEIDFEF
jgi:acyl transferase domain-containing protein/aryl carrier-like protein